MSANPTLHRLLRARAWRAAERGFSLVSAIFLLVILAALGAAIVNVSTVQHMASALDLMGAQAYQAARAGSEWGLYRLPDGAGVPIATIPSRLICIHFALPAGASLCGFTVTVTCTFMPFGGAATAARPTLGIAYNADINVATVTQRRAARHCARIPDRHERRRPRRLQRQLPGRRGAVADDFHLLSGRCAGRTGGNAQGSFTASAMALERRQIIAVACNQPGAAGCPNPSARIDYVERQVQVEF